MVPELESFDLSELSSAAGVTPRTIRYYVQQGLLPSPGTRGPGTRYDRTHLDRLQLVRRLQRQHLPLAEIRKRLETLDDDGVRDALAAPSDPRAGSSALDYVRDVLARQFTQTLAEPKATGGARLASASLPPGGGKLEAPRAPPTAAPRGGAPGRVMPAAPAEAASSHQLTRSSRSTWERIALAADVELHVRRPLSREQNRQVERLLEAARDLFSEEP